MPDRPLKPSPFGASLSSGFGWFCMTTPQCTFSCLVHSRLPSRFCSPVQLFRLFFPFSTHVYQTHAEGRGCLPFTREAGVAPHGFCGVVAIPLARYHLPAWMCSYENQSTLRQAQGQLFAAHPLSLRIVSSEQVAALAGTRPDPSVGTGSPDPSHR